MTLMLVQTI